MKKTDVAMIILIASLSVLAAYFIARSLPVFKDANQPVKVKTATAFTDKIPEPDESLFNPDAINPTVEVIIGGPTQESATQGR
jgi:hypothetical protein